MCKYRLLEIILAEEREQVYIFSMLQEGEFVTSKSEDNLKSKKRFAKDR